MEDRARRVLRANLAKIKESKCDPVWLAEELFAAGIVGEEERLAAKDETVSKEHRRDELLDLVMGNGGESVFQTFVNILSSKRHMHWLAMDLKDEFLRQGGVWMKEEPVRISGDIPEPGAATQTIIPAGDSLDVLDKRLNKDDAVDIVRQLLDVQNKAKTLGRLLELSRAIIEVTPQLTGDPQAPLFYIIDEFLKQVDPRPTWMLILNALKDPLIAEHSLAQEIEVSLTEDMTSPRLPAASLSQSSFPTSVPHSTSPADVLQSTTAAVPLPALTADSQSLSVSQSISTVSVSRSKLPGTGSSSPGDSTQSTKRDSRPTHQAVRHRPQEMAKPTRIHFRAPSPASTSVVHMSRSRRPSSGSLRKKVDYSTKLTASQKFAAVVAKPQPTTPISTSGAVGGHSSMTGTKHSTKHKNTSGQQSSSVVSRSAHSIKPVYASRTKESGGSAVSPSSLPTAVAPTASDMPLSVTYSCDMAEVRSNIQRLHARFEELQKSVNIALVHNRVPVSHIVRELSMLRASIVAELENYFFEDVREFGKCVKYPPLFSRLSPHSHYLSPHLLYHLIRKFLKASKEMVTYNTHLSQFRNETLLRLFAQTKQLRTPLPEGFSSIVVHFKGDVSKDMTLGNVEDFRRRYLKHHKLCDYTLVLVTNGMILPSSASFSVPNSVTERLKNDIPVQLLKEFGVIKFEIAGTPMYGEAGVTVSGVPPSANDHLTIAVPLSPGVSVSMATEQSQLESTQAPPSVPQECETATNTARQNEPADNTSAPTTVHILTIDNAQDVFEMMYEAREKWRNIGRAFRLTPSTLNNINLESQNNDDKLRNVIIEWLNRCGGTGDCTWTHVAMALRNKTVAREDVAREVLEHHPQPWSVPPPHTSPDSGSGTTADTPKPSTSHPQAASGVSLLASTFPVVSVSSMSEMQKKILQRKINEESELLMDEYASLRSRTEHYLLQINCNVEKLVVCVMDVQHVKRLSKVSPLVKLENATTISGVFLELIKNNLMTFLQFSILRRIIRNLCFESRYLQEKLKVYKEKYNSYIRRRVCETHMYHEGRFEAFTASDTEEKVELLIITDENWNDNTEFLRVVDLEIIVAKILHIDNFSLQRESIEPHCLRLRYAISILIAQTVFPLTHEEWKKLSGKGIIKMQCLEYFYTTEDKGSLFQWVSKTDMTMSSKDHLIQFGEGLGMEVGELEKLWDGVLGRYHRAVQSLVAGILQESQYAVEKLVHAISHMRTPESAKTAALAVQQVVLMVECLTVLFKDVKDILLLGQLLRMPEETLAAIDSYYEEDCHKMSHMLSLWLMEDHEDPVTPLRDALNSLGKEEVSQTLVLLTSLDTHAQDVTNTLSASVDIRADDFPWKGHLMTLSSLMQVFKKVIYLDRVSNAFGMSPEAMSGDEEERLGKVSNFFLEKKLTWKHLRKLLIRHNEMQAVKFVDLMEEYVREDAPLTAVLAHEVLKKVENFRQFCKHLCIARRETVIKTIQFYVEEPYFEASWKKIALGLYLTFEDRCIDSLFHYMKSPPEVTLTVANVKNCLEDSVPRHMFPTLERELGVTPRDTREDSHPLTGVKLWLLSNPTASWQKFAIALYSSTLDGALRRLKELKLLSNQDASFTMVNVLSMTEGVQDHEGLGVLLGIRDPQTKFHKIRQLHKSIKEQKEAILHLWYTTHPLASWSLLHQALNMIGDIKAAKTVQEKFLGGSEREAELNMMQIVFTGIPRSGKSSFWKRVQGIIPERLLPSTDITSSEGSVRLDIRGSCGFVLHVSELAWRRIQAEEEMEGFVALVTQHGHLFIQESPQDFSSTAVPEQPNKNPDSPKPDGQPDLQQSKLAQVENEAVEQSITTGTDSFLPNTEGQQPTQQREQDQPHNMPASTHIEEAGSIEGQLPSASNVMNKALISMKQRQLSRKIDSASYVLCTDTGGQPEYQELLALLIAESNTVYIIFNLVHDLHSIQPLEYLPSVDGDPVTYESPHTVGEMLCQSLISVPVHSSGVRGSKKDSQDVSGDGEFQNRSCVFFIGTHKDQASPHRIEAVNRDLIELIRHTPQYKANIVQRCSADSIVFAVDNFSSLENDEEFAVIRRATQGLVYGSHLRVKAPTSWLFTGVVLQNVSETRPMISLSQCQEIARQCGVEQQSFKPCLKFLHNKVGAIRLYETEHLRDVVIIKPQVLINALSHLMRRAFLKPLSRRAVVDDEDINDVVLHFKSITRDRLIEIALDLLVMCRHPNSTSQHPMYYLTCMLPMNREVNGVGKNSVYFTMEGFVLPIGLGRATITAIVQQKMNTKTQWKINYDTFHRNSVEFTVGVPAVSFKISCSAKHLSLSVGNAASVSRETCSDVRIAIESTMTEVLKLYRYGQATTPVVAFSCPSCDLEATGFHYATLVAEDRLECSHTKQNLVVAAHLEKWVLEGKAALLRAAKTGNIDAVKRELTGHTDVNSQDEDGTTAISYAAINGHIDIVRLLIEANADPNLPDKDGFTPLYVACHGGHKLIVDILLENGANANFTLTVDPLTSPLEVAAGDGHTEIVEKLISAGAVINYQNKNGGTPLYVACQNGHTQTVDVLLKNGANPNLTRTVDPLTSPLEAAADKGHTEIVEKLISAGAVINYQNKDGSTPLYAACQNGHKQTVDVLLKNGANANLTTTVDPLSSPLGIAAEKGHTEIVEKLISAGAVINYQNKNGGTPLYVACQNGHTQTVDVLLKNGANPNLTRTVDLLSSPLEVATGKGHTEIVEKLILAGAVINYQNKDGATPLYMACQNGHKQTVDVLLKNGANVNLTCTDGTTPLIMASFKGHLEVVRLLLESGAKDLPYKDGRTAMSVARAKGHHQIVELLQQYKV